MMTNTLRSFASGLLIATTTIGAVYLFGPSTAESTAKPAKSMEKQILSEDEMIEQLASNGFVIHTEEEWNKQLASASANKETEEKQGEKEKKTAEEKVVYRAILSVSMGMTSIDVGNALEKAKIIKDGMEFYKEVEKRGLENELRPGTFEFESGMSMEEIISTIFK
ncbi:endolytic transglycosylase MltG [Rossellomorea vietnamensis]|uniref:Endolytic transglycosylase MltG n=1 Tax=Rossellomorea vietnamensis TaxID=218284 RepID=A0A5D4NMH0_9BACI|nr:endolytic transglycosylase MltG [Rossellomorea vietnamensis]TYS15475.1 endolytic transglycosylase MltG [Rossellomorea vietnamensis]